MKKITLLLLFITFKIIAAQTFELSGGDTINVVDENGKRQGSWIITNALVHRDCYAEDQKVEEGKYADSKKMGFWKEYFCNKNIKSKIFYENNRPNGYAIIYQENGKIKEEGMWKSNKWVGTYKLYYENGQVEQAFNFGPNGKREGEQKYYHPNGQVMIDVTMEGGKESGAVKEYYSNGDIKSIKNFNGGALDTTSVKTFEPKKAVVSTTVIEDVEAPPVKLDKTKEKDNLGKIFNGEGYWQLYNGNKQVTKDGTFLHSRLMDGKAYFYDENGILLRIAIYKGGKYVGDGIIEE